MEGAIEDARRRGDLPTVKMLRDFEPGERVAARVEVSTGGWPGGRTAGIDLMGDGQAVVFSGGVRRDPVQPHEGESPYDAIRRTLAG